MKRILIFTAVAVLLALAGCPGNGPTEQREVKIGAVLSLTGRYSEYGESIRRGMELARETINTPDEDGLSGVGGRDFVIIYEDSGSTPEEAAAAMSELVRDGAEIIVGAETSNLTEAMIPISAANGVMLISPSASSPGLRSGNGDEFFFRICPTDESDAGSIAAEVRRARASFPFLKRPYMRVLVLVRRDNIYSEGLWRAFYVELQRSHLRYEDPIYFSEELLQAEPGEQGEYNEQMLEILSRARGFMPGDDLSNRGAVVIFGFADDVETLMRAFKREGLVGAEPFQSEYLQLYASASVDTAEFFHNAADVAEGLVFTRIFDPTDDENPLVQRFVSAFRRSYGGEPDLYAAYGYDTAMLLALTLRRESAADALDDPRNFRIEMNAVRFDGLTGRVDFRQSNNEVVKSFDPYRMMEGGRAMLLTEYEAMVLRERREEMQHRQ